MNVTPHRSSAKLWEAARGYLRVGGA